MAVKIRLARSGRHELPFYRIVAADHKYARDGKYLEQIGTYDPSKGVEKGVNIDETIALKWLNSGAQYSDTIKSIFKSKGLLEKAKATVFTVKKAKVVSTKSKAKTTTAKKGE